MPGTVINKPTLGTASKEVALPLGPARVQDVPRTVVVLGVERGGTSMVAGVIRAMDISMGERAGLNHEDPNFLTEDAAKLEKYIAARNAQKDVWGFKMPKASLNLDFFDKVLRNPVYVVAYRNPLSIADSWIQRGSGQLLGVMQRIHVYQTAMIDFYGKTRSPVLLVNYERALQTPQSREKLVEDLSVFLSWPIDAAQRMRAIGMMTGDGGGYVNLPEHYFLVAPAPDAATGAPVDVVEATPEPRDPDGWVRQDTLGPKLVFRMADGRNFPTRFRIRIDFRHGQGTRSPGATLRLFFRYTDRFINAHCARPVLQDGPNLLDVETSGLCDALAFGPWQVPCAFRAEVAFHEAPAGAPQVGVAPLPAVPPRSFRQRVKGILRRRLR